MISRATRRAALRVFVRRTSITAALAAGGILLVTQIASSLNLYAPPELGNRALCAAYSGIPRGSEMVFVPGGELAIGSQRGYPEERGGGTEHVDSFWISRTEVTNAQFALFVRATSYVTSAERRGAAPVFTQPTRDELVERGNYAWWVEVKGADWRHPEGPASNIETRANHPVVQVSHEDALAYAKWLGHSLPSEAQWEHAAKALRDDDSLHRAPRDADGKPLANFWQGEFPVVNSGEDGFIATAPVGCYAPNPFGLYDVLGNVWEWTGTSYTSSHAPEDADASAEAASDDAACSASAASDDRLVLKGGSFLCSADFCARYRVAARHSQEPGQPAMHIGFRTVKSAG